jgi:CMP-N,N'-diacetyllegionaminic acid synthase
MTRQKPRVLGVLHARGGSKRIPRKNVKNLQGVPLIAYVCRAALGATLFDRVFLSTDDDEISAAAREYGFDAPFRRPAELAEDVPSEMVTLHALNWAEEDENSKYDIVVTMQPTTPFVRSDDIDAVIETVIRTDAACCFTVQMATQPPEWMFEGNETGEVVPLMAGNLEGERGVFQTLAKRFVPNGAAYATRTDTLRKQNRIIASPTRVHEMDLTRSVDIDEPVDWIVAEAIAEAENYKLIPLPDDR